MDWIVSKNKRDFIGKRALARESMGHVNRKQLVGLLCSNPKTVIPEGAHAVVDPNQSLPMDMLGQVTSSYFSTKLRTFNRLAMLRNCYRLRGQNRLFADA